MRKLKKYLRSIAAALVCFLAVAVLNFLLPRLLPGDPVAYLSGFAEEELTSVQYEYYYNALHLGETLPAQFGHYLRSLFDGTLGYSFQKSSAVAALIKSRIGATLQISLPAVLLSSGLGLAWGLDCGCRRGKLRDRLATPAMLVLNSVPAFLLGLLLIAFFCFRLRLLPYSGLSSPGAGNSLPDRLLHLALPVLTLTLAALPSRFLLMRGAAARAAREKYVLYARQRGLSPGRIKYGYVLPNVVQPFIAMLGMSVSLCVGGSLAVENIFSISGMGRLLTDAVYSLDYPLMQGILFVSTLIMTLAIILSDLVCILIDPRVRGGVGLEA